MYLLREGGKTARRRRACSCWAAARSCARSIAARRAAREGLRRRRRHLERDQLQRAAPRRPERRALEPAASRREAPRKSYVERCLEGTPGPVIAATDYMRSFADQIRAVRAGARYVVLGTDGFGRSDYRVKLRTFFEVDRYYVAVAALKALADEGDDRQPRAVAEAIKKYGIDPEQAAIRWTVLRRTPSSEHRNERAHERDRSESPRHRRLQGRPGDRDPGEARRHASRPRTRWSRSNPTRRRWSARRRSPAW